MDATAAALERSRARRLLRASPDTARALRRQACLTQQDVADALGVSRAAIARWEAGKRLPRSHLAVRYLAFLRAAGGDRP